MKIANRVQGALPRSPQKPALVFTERSLSRIPLGEMSSLLSGAFSCPGRKTVRDALEASPPPASVITDSQLFQSLRAGTSDAPSWQGCSHGSSF